VPLHPRRCTCKRAQRGLGFAPVHSLRRVDLGFAGSTSVALLTHHDESLAAITYLDAQWKNVDVDMALPRMRVCVLRPASVCVASGSEGLGFTAAPLAPSVALATTSPERGASRYRTNVAPRGHEAGATRDLSVDHGTQALCHMKPHPWRARPCATTR
jgi:hypothetical protein